MLDHITHLFRLRAIVEEGSLSRAAERLHVSQPALSRSLGILEKFYGRPLLERHARGVIPTPFGKRVLSAARRVERTWELCEEQLALDGEEESMTLRIGAGLAWRSLILPDILLSMQARFRGLAFDVRPIDYAEAVPDLEDGRLDILFMGALDRLDFKRLVVHPLITVKDRLVARENHPIFSETTEQGEILPSSLANYPWLEFVSTPFFGSQVQDALFGALGFRPKPMMICKTLATAVAVLQRSDYIAILPDVLTIEAIKPKLRPVPLGIHTNYGQAGMICRREMADWPEVEALLAISQDWIKRHPEVSDDKLINNGGVSESPPRVPEASPRGDHRARGQLPCPE